MNFTDIFIRRPVLASTISLLILRARRSRVLRAAGAAISAHRERGRDRYHDLLRRRSRPRGGLHHHAARDRDRSGLWHRLHDVDQPKQHLDNHDLPAAQLRRRQGAYRDQHQDRLGAQSAAGGNAAAGAHRQDRSNHRRNVSGLRQRYARAEPDHRLSHAGRAAQAADGTRCADRGIARPKGVRAAGLARSAKACGIWADRDRRSVRH